MIRLFGLWRGGERKADVVELTSGKCVVSWPSSVVVYDSLAAAEAVHIEHMGHRGEPTQFLPEGKIAERACFCGSKPFDPRCLELGCEAHHVPVKVTCG